VTPPASRRRHPGGEGGSAALTLPVAVLLFTVATLALGDLAGVVVARARAATAADAAALAAAVEVALGSPSPPELQARRLAQANGGRLEACRCPVPAPGASRGATTFVVEVAVTFRPRLVPLELPVSARARADATPARPLP
jgi:Flp pilus assembly protein TadG